MRVYDLYNILLGTGKGQLGGSTAGNGLILYGRIGKELSTLPKMLTNKYEADLRQHEYKLFTFDIFAVQPNDNEVFASEGRIAVLCNKNQQAHEITAISCRLYYNRLFETQSFEANLVIGCYFAALDGGGFSIRPVVTVPRNRFAIKPYEKQLFIDGLVRPSKMQSLPVGTLPRKLGNECPLLCEQTSQMPVFFEVTVKGDFVFRQSLRQFYNLLDYPNLDEDYSNWRLSPELDTFLGYSELRKREKRTQTVLSFQPKPEFVGLVQEHLGDIEAIFAKNRSYFLSDIPTSYQEKFESIAEQLYDMLYENWTSAELGKTGKQIARAVSKVLISNSDTDLHRVESDLEGIISDSSPKDVLETLFRQDMNTELGIFFGKCGISLSKSKSIVAFLWAILGIRSKFSTALDSGVSTDTMLYLILRHPYALTYIAPNISISALDLLACFTGNAYDAQSVIPLRSIACLHSILSNPQDGSLMVEQYKLDISTGYSFTRKEFASYQETGSLLNDTQCWLSKQLLGANTDNSIIQGRVGQTYSGGYQITYDVNPDTVIGYYLNSGMGMQLSWQGKTYLMDYDIARQFVYCVNRLLEPFEPYNDTPDFDALHRAYENEKGIALEEEQAIAAQLLLKSYSCLVGSAGSGKTTTLDYLLYCLQHGFGLSDEDFLLLAPTGMAAKRMRECTGRVAHTIHSGLRIMNTGINWGIQIKPLSDFKARVVVIDETSMISLTLLYHLLMRIPSHVQILFIGDIAQLPPIDYGKPLADMLAFLPHVCLKTIKRASLDSGIIANCQSLLNGKPEFISTNDTRVLPLRDDDTVVDTVADICKSLLGTANLGDIALTHHDGTPVLTSAGCIQVVSPVSKSSYAWSTIRLNDKLQDVFNPRRKGQNRIVYQDNARNDVELRVGDRVVNSANDHEAFRYSYSNSTTLIRKAQCGVLNGDMGTVVDIRDASEFNFLKESNEGLVPDSESLSMANASPRYTKVYVLVEYPDVDGSKYVIIYTGLLEGVFQNGVRLTSSYDVAHLSLAYAVTVHKMQGNQADYVIAPIFKTKARGFISRNLVNTAWSRAKKGLYIIGDVTGTGSAVANAMKIEALDQRLSPFDV